jgi:hypothetical protein
MEDVSPATRLRWVVLAHGHDWGRLAMTRNRKGILIPGTLWILFLVLVAFAIGFGDRAVGVRRAVSAEESWTKVALIYSSDCKGKIEPCG